VSSRAEPRKCSLLVRALARLFVLVWVTGASRVGAGDARRPALHWSRGSGAESCVDPRTLAERVEGFTGPVLVAASAADSSIEARIDRSADARFELRITVTTGRGRPDGERALSLEAADCRSLDTTIAFLIAMTIDPDLAQRGLPKELDWLGGSEMSPEEELRRELAAEPSGPPAQNASALAATHTPPSAAGAPPSAVGAQPSDLAPSPEPRGLPWKLFAAATIGRGSAGRASAGLAAALQRALARWVAAGLQLRAAADFGWTQVDPLRSVTSQSAALALLGCLDPPLSAAPPAGTARAPATWAAQVCVGPELGGLLVHGHGFTPNANPWLWRAGAVARLDVRVWLAGRWALTAAGLFSATPSPPSAHYEGTDGSMTVFRAEHFELHAALGVTCAF
jgi:hypothetical protein